MSIQNNFPTAKTSLLLDFANTKSLDPRITFTRAGTANYYDGKTATKAEQNLLYYSQTLSYWDVQQNITITNNAATAPDGTTTATRITTTSTASWIQQTTGASSGTAGVAYVFSVYVKPTNAFAVTLSWQGPGSGVLFDPNCNFIGYTSYISNDISSYGSTYVGNGWYRVVITVNSAPTTGAAVAIIPNKNRVTAWGWAGSSSVGDTITVWGAQLEQRSTVSAYTVTAASAITNYIPTLQSAASGVPRFTSDPTTGESLGLLIEESRTNLVTASSQFESPAWVLTNATVAANIDSGPDGSLVADAFIENTVNGNHIITQSATVVSGTTYTASIFVKAAGRNIVRFYYNTAGFTNAIFIEADLSTGAITSTSVTGGTSVYAGSSITPVGNGWYRLTVSGSQATSTTGYLTVVLLNAAAGVSYAGNGYSGVFLAGAQLEAGSSATSYVATPLTFTSRASSATYLGPNGYITSAATNVARNQTNSVGTTNLLLESAASNLVKYTDYIGTWSASDCTVAVNQTQSPEGLMFGSKMVESTTANAIHYLTSATFSETSGTTYTVSIYAKAAGRNIIQLNAGTFTGSGVFFDLSSGTVTSGSGGTITAVGGGWYRCSATGASTTTQSTSVVRVYTLVSGTYPFYTGDGVSGVYLWGAQVEAGSTATSYIPSVETWSSRASTATYYNSSGVLATATTGTSRTTYNPALLGAGGKLLLEPAATNLALYSEQFDNANWAKANATVTANATTAPDGNTTADKMVSNNGLSGQLYQTYTKSASPITYTATIYAKAAEFSWLQMAFYDGSANGVRVWFDLSAGATGTSAGIGTVYTGLSYSIQPINNGWYRCVLTATTNSAGSNVLYLYPVNGDGASTTGNGTSGIYIWGAQYETGSGPTSYIATTTASVTRAADASTSAAQSRSADVYSASTVTRAADAASMTGANLTSWFRTDSGTFYSETIKSASNSMAAFWSFDALTIDMASSATNINFRYGSGNSVDLVSNGTYTTARVAGSYQPNANHSLSINGATAITSSTVSTVPAVTTFRIGYGSNGGTFYLNGPVKKIAYYPLTLTDAQLQALTS